MSALTGPALVTAARQGLGETELEREPLAGSVFVADPGVAGPPATPFAHGGGTRSTAPSEADETSAR